MAVKNYLQVAGKGNLTQVEQGTIKKNGVGEEVIVKVKEPIGVRIDLEQKFPYSGGGPQGVPETSEIMQAYEEEGKVNKYLAKASGLLGSIKKYSSKLNRLDSVPPVASYILPPLAIGATFGVTGAGTTDAGILLGLFVDAGMVIGGLIDHGGGIKTDTPPLVSSLTYALPPTLLVAMSAYLGSDYLWGSACGGLAIDFIMGAVNVWKNDAESREVQQ